MLFLCVVFVFWFEFSNFGRNSCAQHVGHWRTRFSGSEDSLSVLVCLSVLSVLSLPILINDSTNNVFRKKLFPTFVLGHGGVERFSDRCCHQILPCKVNHGPITPRKMKEACGDQLTIQSHPLPKMIHIFRAWQALQIAGPTSMML